MHCSKAPLIVPSEHLLPEGEGMNETPLPEDPQGRKERVAAGQVTTGGTPYPLDPIGEGMEDYFS